MLFRIEVAVNSDFDYIAFHPSQIIYHFRSIKFARYMNLCVVNCLKEAVVFSSIR